MKGIRGFGRSKGRVEVISVASVPANRPVPSDTLPDPG